VTLLFGCVCVYWQSVHTIRKNAEALVVITSNETGIEVSADKTKYMIMSRDQK